MIISSSSTPRTLPSVTVRTEPPNRTTDWITHSSRLTTGSNSHDSLNKSSCRDRINTMQMIFWSALGPAPRPTQRLSAGSYPGSASPAPHRLGPSGWSPPAAPPPAHPDTWAQLEGWGAETYRWRLEEDEEEEDGVDDDDDDEEEAVPLPLWDLGPKAVALAHWLLELRGFVGEWIDQLSES